ncbi:MAG: insulinase family protein [Chloroflexi bacterium]|nr:insulinase family protein [Chloroflexota bacterium]
MKTTPELITGALSNGVRYIIQENHTTPAAALSLYVPGGSLFENREDQGISLLCQRMILKSSKKNKWETILEELEFFGARLLPVSGKDISGIQLCVLSRYFAEGVKVMAECVLEPGFRPSEIKQEKKNLLVEVEKRHDDLVGRASDICDELIFTGHPYRFPLMGTEDTIAGLSRENLEEQHKGLYRPARVVIAVCGDIRPGLVHDILEEYFGKFSSSGRALNPSRRDLHLHKRPCEKIERRKKRQASICLGLTVPEIGPGDYYAFSVLKQVLSGMGSRLFINIRDRLGLAYMVHGIYLPHKESGSFKVVIGTSQEHVDKAREAVLREFAMLREKKVSKKELMRAKRYILGLHEIQTQTNQSRSSLFAFNETVGLGAGFSAEFPHRIKKITADDVMESACKYLDLSGYSIALILPMS